MEPLLESLEELLATYRIRYVTASDLSVRRLRRGRGFSYLDDLDRPVRDAEHLARFKALAVPPAWQQVRLAPEPAWHLQAMGRDAAGRAQRRYHAEWEAVRNAAKQARLARFAKALPRIRARVAEDLKRPFGDLDGLCATAVRLIDLAHLRPGNEEALRTIGSRGVTTLAPSNVVVEGDTARLAFRGKSGQWIACEVSDRQLARRLATLKDRNRQRLFRISRGDRDCALSCADLNAYLQRASGQPVSAKDFRTYEASAMALWHLAGTPRPSSQRGRERVLAALSRAVAARLQNTPSIARKSYIHPSIIEAWEAGAFEDGIGDALRRAARAGRHVSREEAALRRFVALAGAVSAKPA